MTTKDGIHVQHFTDKAEAGDYMRRCNRRAKQLRHGILFALVEGPGDGWSVVDLKTAIDLGLGYTIE